MRADQNSTSPRTSPDPSDRSPAEKIVQLRDGSDKNTSRVDAFLFLTARTETCAFVARPPRLIRGDTVKPSCLGLGPGGSPSPAIVRVQFPCGIWLYRPRPRINLPEPHDYGQTLKLIAD